MIGDQSNKSSCCGLTPIRPELVAGKLAAIRNHEYPEALQDIANNPRLVEMLWFIQAMSFQPGGLSRFVQDMADSFPERFMPEALAGRDPHEITIEDKLKAYSRIPDRFREAFPLNSEEHCNVVSAYCGSTNMEEEILQEDRDILARATQAWSIGAFQSACVEAAKEALPAMLEAICIDKDTGFVSSGRGRSYERPLKRPYAWFLGGDLFGSVIAMMDRQSARASRRLAMTEVAKLVFDRLDYALAEKVMVRIEGCSRFGKTEAISAWVDMRPGLARLVRVPCDNSMASLFKRIAEAFGIDCS